MLKQTIIILTFLFYVPVLKGQNFKIVYELVYSFDTLEIQNIKREYIVTFVKSTQESLSGPENFFKKDSAMHLLENGKITQDDYLRNRHYYKFSDEIGFVIRKNYKDNVLNVFENIYTNYYLHNRSQHLEWVLNDGEKLIEEFKCKKATLDFGGRKYTCWYAADIPINEGPLLFSGLPGLILELYDDKHHYNFTFKGLNEIGNQYPELKYYVNKSILSKREKVFELRELYRIDLLKYIKLYHGTSISDAGAIQIIKEKAVHKNNPLELELSF